MDASIEKVGPANPEPQLLVVKIRDLMCVPLELRKHYYSGVAKSRSHLLVTWYFDGRTSHNNSSQNAGFWSHKFRWLLLTRASVKYGVPSYG